MAEVNQQQKAEAYVRSQIPELMELSRGCEISFRGFVYNEEGETSMVMRGYIVGGGFYGSYEVVTTDVVNDDWKNIQYDVPLGKIDKIIGHPIQLHHWLRVLKKVEAITDKDGTVVQVVKNEKRIYFNLTTGQPATEADYKVFNEIVGV